MMQLTRVKGKNVPFSRIVLVKPARQHLAEVIVQVPVNVSFATDVRIQTSKADRGISTPFDYCVPAGCFAHFKLDKAAVRRLLAAHRVGRISFANAARHEIIIPLSFKGFRQAYEALLKR